MLMIDGNGVETPFPSVNWLDKPSLRAAPEDRGKRGLNAAGKPRPFIQIVHHTTSGIWPQEIRPGFGPHTGRPLNIVSSWRRDGRMASAHLIVDFDGVVYQTADLHTEVTWHAQGMNRNSVGIENVQDPSRGGLYEGQLQRSMDVTDWLIALPSNISVVQRIIPDGYHGAEDRFAGTEGETNWYGVIGHRVRKERGRGDPGDRIFEIAAERGYEKFNVAARADIAAWKRRQTLAGVTADGLPGTKTRDALDLLSLH